MKDKIKKFIRDESGVSFIEYVLVIAMLSLLIVIVRSYFNYYFIGEPGNPDRAGLARRLFSSSAQGLSDVNRGLVVYDGCDPSVTNVKAYDCDKIEAE